jgi:hypothetical protein
MSLLSEVLIQLSIYAAILLGGFFVANVVSGGAVFKVLRCKLSGGKRILLKVHGVTGPYLATGRLVERQIKFRVRGSKNDSVTIIPEGMVIVKWLGAYFVEVYEDGRVVTQDFRVESGHDGEVIDSLMKRIAMLPKRPGIQELLLIIGIILCVCGIAYLVFKMGEVEKALEYLVTVAQVSEGVVPGGVTV